MNNNPFNRIKEDLKAKAAPKIVPVTEVKVALEDKTFCTCAPDYCVVQPNTHCRRNNAFNPPLPELVKAMQESEQLTRLEMDAYLKELDEERDPIVRRIIASAKSLAYTMFNYARSWWPWQRHALDTMSRERYNQLMEDATLPLSKEEFETGYRFCCDWDGLLIHASHPEANSCTCLESFRKANGIKDTKY